MSALINSEDLKAELAKVAHVVNGNAPVFPFVDPSPELDSHRGLTKRELFAAMAMQGLATDEFPEGCATSAVKYADALLAELAKEPNP